MAQPIYAAQGKDTGLSVNPLNIYSESEDRQVKLGTRLVVGERTFHYALAGAEINRGQICEAAALGGAVTTAQLDLAIPTAIVAGENSILVTTLTTAQTKNRFENGWISIVSDTIAHGCGQAYKIKGHLGQSAAGALVVNLYDQVENAITTDCKATLTANLYARIKLTAVTTAVGIPVGVALSTITSGYYFWLQTWGPCCLLTGSTVIVDSALIRGLEAGEADIQATTGITPEIGYAIDGGSDGDYPLSFLRIAP